MMASGIGIVLLGFIPLLSSGIQNPVHDSARENFYSALNLGPSGAPPEPAGAPLLSCSISRDNCGSISPSANSVYIADGAYDLADGTLFFVDVPSGSDGVFQVDPSTCEIVQGTYYSVNYGMSQRGIGYDPEYHRIWVGGWNDGFLNQHSAAPPYLTVSYTFTGLDIGGIAVSDADDYLFVGTSGYPDMLYVYDIGGGALGELLGSWPIPWQTYSDGYDMAGLSYDDDLGRLVMVNQAAAGPGTKREIFDFDILSGPVGTDHCELGETDFAWGVAVVEE